MKIFLAQQNYHIGHFGHNVNRIIQAINTAKEKMADLVVFSELSVCGYPPRDFLYFDDFIEKCQEAIEQIRQVSSGIAVLVGAPVINTCPNGKRLHNAACFIEDGVIKQWIHKTCLPTYDIFDENRYFEPATTWEVIAFRGKKIAVTICEDIWNLGDHPLYKDCPMDKLMPLQPDLMINLSASPFDYTHSAERLQVICANAVKYQLPVLYCNAVGSQTELVFDGQSAVVNKAGVLEGMMPAFAEDMLGVEMGDGGAILSVTHRAKKEILTAHRFDFFDAEVSIDSIHQALICGIRDYFGKMGFQQAILGSSGGIDSAVVLALAVEALGAENVTAVLMPSRYSSDHSVKDAVALSEALKNPYHIIPIEEVNTAILQTLEPYFADTSPGLAEENIQSRIRGNLLMGMANKFGFILLNTSNKSELATGYGTLYGDMAGGIGVLGDCYKMQVYALARYINRNETIIPLSILQKAPSAELRPDQKDSDSLPEYDLLDRILFLYIERELGPQEIKNLGFDPALVDRILKMVNNNEYKRNQFCPIIRVSPKAFGQGRRMPIVARYLG
jgi:NAD+ synthase (glutamine-hydrolysing)